jgi:hypothetical protein
MSEQRLAERFLAKDCAHASVIDGRCTACGFTFNATDATEQSKPDDAGEAREEIAEEEAPTPETAALPQGGVSWGGK